MKGNVDIRFSPLFSSLLTAALLAAVAASILALPEPAGAQEGEIPESTTVRRPGIVPPACRFEAIRSDPSGCTVCHIGVMTINLTNFFMFAIAIPGVALLVAVGGIILLVSGGSETRVSLGKTILARAIAGAFIVFLAWLAVDTTFKVLAGQRGFRGAFETLGPWNQFPAERCGI